MRCLKSPWSQSPQSWSLIPLSCLLLLAVACGGEDEAQVKQWDPNEKVDMDVVDMSGPSQGVDMAMPEPDLFMLPDVNAPLVPVSVETKASTDQASAGDTVRVTCLLFDAEGNKFDASTLPDAPTFVIETVGDGLENQDDSSWKVTSTGTKTFGCRVGEFGLIDQTPEVVEVSAGTPARVLTSLNKRTMSAGEDVQASCKVYDEFDNEVVDAKPTLSSDKTGDGVTLMELGANIEKADNYILSCQVPGAMSTGAPLEVVPGLPASLVVGPFPRQMVYGIGQVVQVESVVTDRFGNSVPRAKLSWTQSGGVSFGQGRFRFDQEGTYKVTTTVEGKTYQDVELKGNVEFLVNGFGPSIRCEYPANGEQITSSVGSSVDVTGIVNDTNGVATVTVNGMPYQTDAQGKFTAPVVTRYGINFIDISAKDQFGVENSRTCAFMASRSWLQEGDAQGDAVMLKLRQSAVDDRNSTDPLDSLNDVLVRVLNSQGLVTTIDTALRGANPLSDGCLQRTLGVCTVRAKITYLNSSLGGPHTSSITLIRDGLRLVARVRNISIRLNANGTAVGFVPFSVTGTGQFEYVEVDLTSNLQLTAGRPRITLRRVEATRVGDINVQINNVPQLVTNLVTSLFQNAIRNLVRDQIRSLISSQFNTVLDSVISNLDISSLGSTFSVPRLDGAGNTPINFGVSFTSLGVSTARALFGIGTRFTSPVVRTGMTRGAPKPEGSVFLDPSITSPLGVSVHVVVLNQVLHALWRANYFSGTVSAATLGQGLPAGVSADLEFGLQPLVIFESDKKIRAHLGAVSISLIYPGLFDEPLRVELGATATGTVNLQGETLSFGALALDEFYFSTPDVSVDETTRDVLEGLLKDLVQNILDTSLNSALPTLPIPNFTLPASLSQYGLPANGKLGLKNPRFDTSTRHVTLQGALGIQ